MEKRKEFLILMRTQGDCSVTLEAAVHRTHLQKMMNYIDSLKKQGCLISAQPLSMNGSMLQAKQGTIKDGPFTETKEVIAGYFLIRAKNLNEALEIARKHPLLEDDPDSRLEIREIKQEEGIN
ncbi:MAG TPA: YciI family protein [Bacteroidia bacterium]|jgi:hypothetical protein|nr:YciI family protein [Bacteroidia bacterium]